MKINKRLVLASKSPRRYDLLSPHFFETIVVDSGVEEKYFATEPSKIVEELAKLKLGDLPQKYFDDIVVTGDTIVWFDGEVYGKPKDKEQAYLMLERLSGNCHQVYSGFAVAYQGQVVVGFDVSNIQFKKLSHDDIVDYIKTGSPMDKAGAYGVQDGVVVESFTGDINTIIGLPLEKILKVSKELLANG